MAKDPTDQEAWRDRKRRETLQRIADTALRLFTAHGYEATTLEAIAQASGISRRTFFYYFKSKEEILLAWQSRLPDAVRLAVRAQSTHTSPLKALRSALSTLTADFGSAQAVEIDRILRSMEQLRASNLAKYLAVEQAAFEALGELWPEPAMRPSLRVAAMAGVGALRLAIDEWAEQGGRRPLSHHLDDAFASLDESLGTPRSGADEA